MFHRRYSAVLPAPPSAPPEAPAPAEPSGFRHDAKLPGDALAAHREKLRQRHEEGLLEQQLLETEQELDGIIEEEKQLARRRQELQALNERQTGFRDRRLALEDRINETLLEFERESLQCMRDARSLEEALGTCRRYLQDMEQMAPAAVGPLRSDSALRRQLDFLADFERRLGLEMSGLDAAGCSPAGVPEKRTQLGFGDSLRRGAWFFLPYIGVGFVVLLLFLSLTGGGK